MQTFEQELQSLINKHCMENEWDMPDFIMAKLINDFIKAAGKSMKQNLDWHGTDSVCHPKVPESDATRNPLQS